MEELFSVMQFMLKEREGRREEKLFTSIYFVFWISKFHYVAGCFPVSAFSVSGKADVTAAGAITLICSTGGEKKKFCSDFLPLFKKISHLALFWACQQKR